MVVKYTPILKGKLGEFTALWRADPLVCSQIRPIIEVVPKNGPQGDLVKFCERASRCHGQSLVLAVDLHYMEDAAGPVDGLCSSPIKWIGERLGSAGVLCSPVFRIEDSDEFLVDVGTMAREHNSGACLRVGGDEADPDSDYLRSEFPAVIEKVGLSIGDVDLVIDLSEVNSERDVSRATPAALAAVDWAHSVGTWRSVTIASGAFPASISHLPTNTSTPLPRLDAQLWDAVHAARPSARLDYGDYMTANPGVPLDGGRGPLPNLRYVDGRDWHVYRWKRSRPGNKDFFTLSGSVVGSSHWPTAGPNYSWGDAEIARCAAEIEGAGSAYLWLAYGFSHHLAHVTERLANLRVP